MEASRALCQLLSFWRRGLSYSGLIRARRHTPSPHGQTPSYVKTKKTYQYKQAAARGGGGTHKIQTEDWRGHTRRVSRPQAQQPIAGSPPSQRTWRGHTRRVSRPQAQHSFRSPRNLSPHRPARCALTHCPALGLSGAALRGLVPSAGPHDSPPRRYASCGSANRQSHREKSVAARAPIARSIASRGPSRVHCAVHLMPLVEAEWRPRMERYVRGGNGQRAVSLLNSVREAGGELSGGAYQAAITACARSNPPQWRTALPFSC